MTTSVFRKSVLALIALNLCATIVPGQVRGQNEKGADNRLYSSFTDGSVTSGDGAKTTVKTSSGGKAAVIGPDGHSFWLCYSANWENQLGKHHPSIPAGGSYSMTLQHARLLTPNETIHTPEMTFVP